MNYISLPENSKIGQATQFVRIFSDKRREFLNIISGIKRSYKNSGYYVSDLESKDVNTDLKTIGRSISNKESRIIPYSDPVSREEYESELYEKYKIEESMQEYVVSDTESKKRGFQKFEVVQKKLLRNFFKPHSDDPLENRVVKLVKIVTGYYEPIDLLAFLLKKKILKQIQLKIKGKELKLSLKRSFFKKELINQQKMLNKDLQKLLNRTKKAESQSKFKVSGILWRLDGISDILLKPLLKLLPIFGLLFSLWFISFLSEALFLPMNHNMDRVKIERCNAFKIMFIKKGDIGLSRE